MSEAPDTILHQDDVEAVIEQTVEDDSQYFVRGAAVTLVAGTKAVADTNINANSIIRLTVKTPAGTPGALFVASKTPATGYTITSTSNTDTSVVYPEIDYDGVTDA